MEALDDAGGAWEPLLRLDDEQPAGADGVLARQLVPVQDVPTHDTDVGVGQGARMSRVVLVHGAWHGSWCWRKLSQALEGSGHTVETVDLPSAGGAGDLAADAAVVRAALDSGAEPAVLVGHSYGGIPITQASAGSEQVSHLVYLCAFMLDDGESLLSALDHQTPPWIAVDQDAGVSRVPEPLPVFYADVEPAEAEDAAARLTTQTLSSFGSPLTRVGWHTLPSTYLACTQDQAIPYAAQQAMSARAAEVHTLDSSHSPFLSHVDEVAALIDGL